MSFFDNLLGSLQNKTQSTDRVVGLDIGSSAIKVVELQDRKGVITLTTYGELQVGPYAAKEIGQIAQLNPKQSQTAVVDVLRESGAQAKEAVFAVPLSSSFVTNVSFLADEGAKIDAQVRVEARKVIPMSLSEVAMDWVELEAERNSAESNHRSVMIAAIQNDALQQYQVLLQFVGLGASPTEIECFSAIRALHDPQEKTMAIVDIGAGVIKMYLVNDGVLTRLHRLSGGGLQATKRIASVLELNFEEAEIQKRTITREDNNFRDVQKAHHSCFERAFSEFRQVMDQYTRDTGVNIETMYLTGSASVFPGMQSYLQDMLRVEVLKAHPFGRVAYPAFMEDVMYEIGPTFTPALGAALRQFDI